MALRNVKDILRTTGILRHISLVKSCKNGYGEEDIDSLRTLNWESWRLDKWDRIDIKKINEGVKSCKEKSGHFKKCTVLGSQTIT